MSSLRHLSSLTVPLRGALRIPRQKQTSTLILTRLTTRQYSSEQPHFTPGATTEHPLAARLDKQDVRLEKQDFHLDKHLDRLDKHNALLDEQKAQLKNVENTIGARVAEFVKTWKAGLEEQSGRLDEYHSQLGKHDGQLQAHDASLRKQGNSLAMHDSRLVKLHDRLDTQDKRVKTALEQLEQRVVRNNEIVRDCHKIRTEAQEYLGEVRSERQDLSKDMNELELKYIKLDSDISMRVSALELAPHERRYRLLMKAFDVFLWVAGGSTFCSILWYLAEHRQRVILDEQIAQAQGEISSEPSNDIDN